MAIRPGSTVLETLRDRRALFTTLVLPIVVYPLLFTAIGSFTSNKREEIAKRSARVAVWGAVPEGAVQAVLQEKATLVERVASVPADAVERARKAVADKQLDVVLVTPDAAVGPSVPVKVYADSTQLESDAMQERVLKALRKHEAARALHERLTPPAEPAITGGSRWNLFDRSEEAANDEAFKALMNGDDERFLATAIPAALKEVRGG